VLDPIKNARRKRPPRVEDARDGHPTRLSCDAIRPA
jgi:hypothetical protein